MVPDQEPSQIKYAYSTARSLHGELAGFRDTAMTKAELEKAKEAGYLLAVAPEGLPKANGWYQVCHDTASFKSISEEEATSLKKAERWDEVLYVNQGAVIAAEESRPLALGVGYNKGRGNLYVGNWPDLPARVALVKPEAAMLRVEDGKASQVTFRNGDRQLLSDVAEVQEIE